MNYKGTCGEHVLWILYGRTLVIRGSGAIDLLYGYETKATSLSQASIMKIDHIPWREIRHKVKYLLIFDGITSIDDVAFIDFSNLEIVWLPTSLETIGDNAFQDCQKLTAINWSTPLMNPDASPNLYLIGNMAFAGCTQLKKFKLPDSIERIGYNAFEGGCELIKE